jgi:hypothetical protein
MNRKILVGRFELLQADDVGFRLLQPSQQVRQAPVDVLKVAIFIGGLAIIDRMYQEVSCPGYTSPTISENRPA